MNCASLHRCVGPYGIVSRVGLHARRCNNCGDIVDGGYITSEVGEIECMGTFLSGGTMGATSEVVRGNGERDFRVVLRYTRYLYKIINEEAIVSSSLVKGERNLVIGDVGCSLKGGNRDAAIILKGRGNSITSRLRGWGFSCHPRDQGKQYRGFKGRNFNKFLKEARKSGVLHTM